MIYWMVAWLHVRHTQLRYRMIFSLLEELTKSYLHDHLSFWSWKLSSLLSKIEGHYSPLVWSMVWKEWNTSFRYMQVRSTDTEKRKVFLPNVGMSLIRNCENSFTISRTRSERTDGFNKTSQRFPRTHFWGFWIKVENQNSNNHHSIFSFKSKTFSMTMPGEKMHPSLLRVNQHTERVRKELREMTSEMNHFYQRYCGLDEENEFLRESLVSLLNRINDESAVSYTHLTLPTNREV